MRLDINDKYCITSDSFQYVVNVKRVSNSEETKGQEYLTPEAYLPSITQCLKWIVDHSIRTSNTQGFRELQSHLNKIHEDIIKACTVNGLKVSESQQII
jgi:hypothetical protein